LVIGEAKSGSSFRDLVSSMERKASPYFTKDYIFVVLFCFSIYDVIPWEIESHRVAGGHLVFGNRFIGAGIWLSTLGLLLYIMWHNRYAAKEVITRHGFDFATGGWIVAWVLIGCMVNFDWQGEQWPHSVVLMVSAIACYSFFFICIFLFLLKTSNKGYVVFLVMLVLVNLIPWWQKYNYDFIRPFIRYTLAWHLCQVSSVLRIASIYGAFAAICAVFFGLRAFRGVSRKMSIRILEGTVALTASLGVFLSSSVTGLLGLFVGIFSFFWIIIRKKSLFIIAGIILFVVFNFFIIQDSEKASTIGGLFPYIQKLHNHEYFGIKDFIPKLSSTGLSERPRIWKRALDLWSKSPWLGIGLGQYNIQSEYGWVTNVHNVYLNILTECGILVFIPFCTLLGRFIYKMRSNDSLMPVLMSILVMSFFENIFDKSFPWILMCSWIIVTAIKEPA